MCTHSHSFPHLSFSREIFLCVCHKQTNKKNRHSSLIRTVPFLADLPPDFLGRLALCLRPVPFGAGEYCFVAGDVAKSMYFLLTGRVQREKWVVSHHGRCELSQFRISTGPSFFGEEGVIRLTTFDIDAEERTRSYSIRTITFCDCYSLERNDLKYLMDEYVHYSSLSRYSHFAKKKRTFIESPMSYKFVLTRVSSLHLLLVPHSYADVYASLRHEAIKLSWQFIFHLICRAFRRYPTELYACRTFFFFFSAAVDALKHSAPLLHPHVPFLLPHSLFTI